MLSVWILVLIIKTMVVLLCNGGDNNCTCLIRGLDYPFWAVVALMWLYYWQTNNLHDFGVGAVRACF